MHDRSHLGRGHSGRRRRYLSRLSPQHRPRRIPQGAGQPRCARASADRRQPRGVPPGHAVGLRGGDPPLRGGRHRAGGLLSGGRSLPRGEGRPRPALRSRLPGRGSRAMIASHRARVVAAFAAIYLMWGGTFLAIRYAVADIPPLMTMVLRCAAGASLLLAWLAWRGTLVRPSRGQWLTTGGAGVLLFLGCHGLLAWAEQRVTSGEAALFLTVEPLWLIGLESLLARQLPSSRVILALVLGIAGVGVLTWDEGWSGGLLDRAALVASALFWAAGTVIVRRGGTPLPAAQSTAMQLGAGAAALLVASLAVGELRGWSPAEITPRALLSLAFLVVGGTVLGFGAYTWLIRVTSAAAVSTY